MDGALLPAPVDCAEMEIGTRQKARNPSLAFMGDLLVSPNLIAALPVNGNAWDCWPVSAI
jgi:hypothetical protein